MSRLAPVLAGLLLLAPAAHATLNISAGPTKKVVCVSGTCTSAAKNAALNVSELLAMLANGDVTVQADGGAQTISVLAPLSWSAAHTLTLRAQHDVVIKAPVAVEGLGGVQVVTGTGGDLKFSPGGRIDFWDTGASFVFNAKSYVLANDVAAMAAAYAAQPSALLALAKDYDAGLDGRYAHAPVPNKVTGTFEGLGHTIANLQVESADSDLGLFANVEGGALRDVTLSGANVFSDAPRKPRQVIHGGVLVGFTTGPITGVHISGSLRGSRFIMLGGIAGVGAAFTRSDADVTVMCSGGACNAGGLAGYALSAVLQSHASGDVTSGAGSSVGGLVGDLYGSIAQSYATGNVFADNRNQHVSGAGGLAGLMAQSATIADSYARGAVRSTHSGVLGGLVGHEEGNTVKTSYSTGQVQENTGDGARRGPGRAGGFIGDSEFYWRDGYANDYWDLDTSGLDVACGEDRQDLRCKPLIRGLSDAELKSALPAGFDPAIWGQDPAINHGYPYLLNNPPD